MKRILGYRQAGEEEGRGIEGGGREEGRGMVEGGERSMQCDVAHVT